MSKLAHLPQRSPGAIQPTYGETQVALLRRVSGENNVVNHPQWPALADQLLEVCEEAKTPDWDGAGAKPVSDGAYQMSLRLLRRIPSTVQTPEIFADTDGSICFEWYMSRRSFAIFVAATEVMMYVGYYSDSEQFSGRRVFPGQFPAEFLNWIRLVYDHTD